MLSYRSTSRDFLTFYDISRNATFTFSSTEYSDLCFVREKSVLCAITEIHIVTSKIHMLNVFLSLTRSPLYTVPHFAVLHGKAMNDNQ